jgi:hypothetical protein
MMAKCSKLFVHCFSGMSTPKHSLLWLVKGSGRLGEPALPQCSGGVLAAGCFGVTAVAGDGDATVQTGDATGLGAAGSGLFTER